MSIIALITLGHPLIKTIICRKTNITQFGQLIVGKAHLLIGGHAHRLAVGAIHCGSPSEHGDRAHIIPGIDIYPIIPFCQHDHRQIGSINLVDTILVQIT